MNLQQINLRKLRKKEAHKKWREANKELHNLKGKLWREANPDRMGALKASWLLKNPNKRKEYNAQRRSKVSNDKFPSSLWAELLRITSGYCLYCRTKTEKIVIDHVVPICKGGGNSINNLMPSCNRCNLSKGSKDLDKWLEMQRGF